MIMPLISSGKNHVLEVRIITESVEKDRIKWAWVAAYQKISVLRYKCISVGVAVSLQKKLRC